MNFGHILFDDFIHKGNTGIRIWAQTDNCDADLKTYINIIIDNFFDFNNVQDYFYFWTADVKQQKYAFLTYTYQIKDSNTRNSYAGITSYINISEKLHDINVLALLISSNTFFYDRVPTDLDEFPRILPSNNDKSSEIIKNSTFKNIHFKPNDLIIKFLYDLQEPNSSQIELYHDIWQMEIITALASYLPIMKYENMHFTNQIFANKEIRNLFKYILIDDTSKKTTFPTENRTLQNIQNYIAKIQSLDIIDNDTITKTYCDFFKLSDAKKQNYNNQKNIKMEKKIHDLNSEIATEDGSKFYDLVQKMIILHPLSIPSKINIDTLGHQAVNKTYNIAKEHLNNITYSNFIFVSYLLSTRANITDENFETIISGINQCLKKIKENDINREIIIYSYFTLQNLLHLPAKKFPNRLYNPDVNQVFHLLQLDTKSSKQILNLLNLIDEISWWNICFAIYLKNTLIKSKFNYNLNNPYIQVVAAIIKNIHDRQYFNDYLKPHPELLDYILTDYISNYNQNMNFFSNFNENLNLISKIQQKFSNYDFKILKSRLHMSTKLL